MIPRNLNYNYKDIFLAPRLALSGKKIFLILKGNLVGYIAYFLFSYVSLLTNGMDIENIIFKYGLYPYLFGHGKVVFLGYLFIWDCYLVICIIVESLRRK